MKAGCSRVAGWGGAARGSEEEGVLRALTGPRWASPRRGQGSRHEKAETCARDVPLICGKEDASIQTALEDIILIFKARSQHGL